MPALREPCFIALRSSCRLRARARTRQALHVAGVRFLIETRGQPEADRALEPARSAGRIVQIFSVDLSDREGRERRTAISAVGDLAKESDRIRRLARPPESVRAVHGGDGSGSGSGGG